MIENYFAKLKDKIKKMSAESKKNKLNSFDEIENRLFDYGYERVSEYYFIDDAEKIAHNKDIYVNKKAGLFVTIYFVSDENGNKTIKQISCIGQYKNSKPFVVRCVQFEMTPLFEFVDKIEALSYNTPNIQKGQWETIGERFSLIDDYDITFFANSRANKNFDFKNNKFYNHIFKYEGAYNDILGNNVHPLHRYNLAQFKTTYYVSNSKSIQEVLGRDLSYSQIWETKILNEDINEARGLKEVFVNFDKNKEVEKLKIITREKEQDDSLEL